MNDPMAGQLAAMAATRVLAVAARGGAELARCLAAPGFTVESIRTPQELARRLGQESYHAVVLDLRPATSAAGDMGELAESLSALPTDPAAGRPLILALAAHERHAEKGPLRIDAWIDAGDIARAAREVRGTVAVRRLQDAGEQIERLRRAVLHARHTAHELAQPLTTILARSQLLAANLAKDHPQHKAITVIATEAERLARITEGFARLKEIVEPPVAPKK